MPSYLNLLVFDHGQQIEYNNGIMKVYGDYHTHTLDSDGVNTIDENIAAAKQRGLSEIGITDHAHHRPHNKKKRLQNALMAKAQVLRSGKNYDIKTFYGTECNVVGLDGDIDIANDERKLYDYLVCGIHVSVQPKNFWQFFSYYIPNMFFFVLHRLGIAWTPKSLIRKNTRAVINVIEKNNIDILSHPNRYFRVNVIEVAKACIARGTAMELNNKKVSFRPVDFERMVAMGAKFVINSDAHKAENVGRMDRVEAFLKLCDYDPACILNLDGPFERPKAQILDRIVKAENESAWLYQMR